ncbi:MAG: tRNA lysidine(34) synthetase TilS [Flavobacteriales bacterium]
MGSSLDTIRKSLDQHVKAHPASAYLVAVSGGLDSMLLLHLLHQIGAPVQAVHINYRLRQQESEQDAKLIEDYCATNQIPLHLYRVTDAQQIDLQSSNLQAKARNIRYTYFEQVSAIIPNSIICTAHHADDQNETFWLQLARGAGMKGLAGMPTIFKNLLRPFLCFSKTELLDAAEACKLEWREDQSNQSTKYRRNVWRNQFLPELTEHLPNLKDSVLQLQAIFQSEIRNQQKTLNIAIQNLNTNGSITLKELSLLSVYQFIELFKTFNVPVQIIQRIPELFHSENGKKLTWKAVDREPSALLIFNHALWLLQRELKPHAPCPYYFEQKQTKKLPSFFDLNEIYLDATLLSGELYLRTLDISDVMYPVGMKGKKSAFEILKEHKIPGPLRDKIWGLFDQEKLILIPSVKLDRRVLAHHHSEQILQVNLYKKT